MPPPLMMFQPSTTQQLSGVMLDTAWSYPGQVAYSNNNLTALMQSNSNGFASRANLGHIDGKRQWEITVDSFYLVKGFAGVTTVNGKNSQFITNVNGWGLNLGYQSFYSNNSVVASASASVTGVAGIVVDFNIHTIYIYNDGILVLTYSGLPANTMLYPTMSSTWGTVNYWMQATINFGSSPFKHPVADAIPYNS